MGVFDSTKFRQRFVKDYNLPINIFSDDNIWAHYVRLYDFFPMVEYYRVFFCENQLAMFNEPLKLIENV